MFLLGTSFYFLFFFALHVLSFYKRHLLVAQGLASGLKKTTDTQCRLFMPSKPVEHLDPTPELWPDHPPLARGKPVSFAFFSWIDIGRSQQAQPIPLARKRAKGPCTTWSGTS